MYKAPTLQTVGQCSKQSGLVTYFISPFIIIFPSTSTSTSVAVVYAKS